MFKKDGSIFVIHELENQYLPDLLKNDALGGPRITCLVIVEG